MIRVLIHGLRAIMVKRSLRQSCLIACFAIVAGFLFAAPSLSASRPSGRQVALHVSPRDTGKTVALAVGQQLIVTLPLGRYGEGYWRVVRNSDGALKLIAGPDERRPRDLTSRKRGLQVFYFRRESPGTAHLVLEQSPWSKPMLLEVVDP